MGAYVIYAGVRNKDLRIDLSGAPEASYDYLHKSYTRSGPSLSAQPETDQGEKPGGRTSGLKHSSNAHWELIVLSYPLPLWIAESALRDIQRIKWGSLTRRGLPFVHLFLRFFSHRMLARYDARGTWRPLKFADEGTQFPTSVELQHALTLLSGRLLLEREVHRLFEEEGEGVFTSHSLDLLEQLVMAGDAVRRAALFQDGAGRWRCRRCGSRDRVDIGPCVRCNRKDCASCTECAGFGVARACEAIIAVPPIEKNPRRADATSQKALLQLEFSLSPAQKRAADALLKSEAQRSLVWAACGAGKTEVTYPLIERYLSRGEDVLFAVPRRDIVHELGERLQKAFPSVRVKALRGGVDRKYEDARLFVATTHQVLRFYRRFPLVVLDEVDAFPYRGNEMLRRAINRSRTKEGRLVYMTATPTESLLQRARRDKWETVTIPARHHGHPLPVPEAIVLPGLARTEHDLERNARHPAVPKVLVECIHRFVRSGSPLIVFVPTVRLVAPTAAWLDKVCRSGARPDADALPLVYGIHSRHPRRDAIRAAFAKGEFPVLVATTVLERGITVPRVNVIVLWADNERVFDAPTLIQMAGRVGRTQDHPTGMVQFMASRHTRAMHEAIARINELNEEAKAAGDLRQAR